MFFANHSDVHLSRVTLRGLAATLTAARAPVRIALTQTDWPSTAPGELLFIRKINVQGEPREIAARARQQAQHLAREAVDGWSGSAADAMAVRFGSYASLLACLLRDLLRGSAQHSWYWRSWYALLQQTQEQALVALIRTSPLHLPTVVDLLRNTAEWQTFWVQLGHTGAEQIINLVAQSSGWSITLQAAKNSLRPDSPALIELHNTDRLIEPEFDLDFLAGSNIHPAGDARFLLAALLTVWKTSPALLNNSRGAYQLQQLIRRLRERVLHKQPVQSETTVGENPQAAHDGRPNVARLLRVTEAPEQIEIFSKLSVPDSFAPGEYPVVDIARRADTLVQRPERRARNTKYAVEDFSPATYANEQLVVQHSILPEYDFITEQGGLFYLVNFLKLDEVQSQLPNKLYGAGWRWLYALASEIDCPPQDALLDFFVRACGFESAAELAAQPALHISASLIDQAVARYGNAAWNQLRRSSRARFIADSSHVDLHFRLNDARLPLRRAGLDLNPGWMPWLGRVVSFHYGSGKEPL